MQWDPYLVLRRLSNSRDKVTLKRRLHVYRLNFRRRKAALRYLDGVERIIAIRR